MQVRGLEAAGRPERRERREGTRSVYQEALMTRPGDVFMFRFSKGNISLRERRTATTIIPGRTLNSRPLETSSEKSVSHLPVSLIPRFITIIFFALFIHDPEGRSQACVL